MTKNKQCNIMDKDRELLMRAIELADKGMIKGGGPFGAVIAREGKVLAEAVNSVVLNSDPTAHAEIVAIRKAASVLDSHELKDCTLYCSCEPCPMCLGAIYWAGIEKVIYSCDRKDAEEAGFSDRDIYDQIKLAPGKRRIRFRRLATTEGKEVLRRWESYDNKIQY